VDLHFFPRHASTRGSVSSIMVYDWAGKRDICYRMYIQDKKALEEIMEYMRTAYQFAPR
jgi:hypothetical protein